MRQAASVVDLGTGGGERLLKLRKHWPEKVVVTEDYPPSAQEWSGRLAFTDVGAIVCYLKAVPWLVPGFTVETHVRYLFELQSRLENGETLAFVARKYLIEACKENAPASSLVG